MYALSTAKESLEHMATHYHRLEERPSGLVVPHFLGTTAVLAKRPDSNLEIPSLVARFSAHEAPTEPLYTEGQTVHDLDELVRSATTVWQGLLSGTEPLHVHSGLAEERKVTYQQTQGGLWLDGPSHPPKDEFVRYYALPDEIAAIESIHNRLRAQIPQDTTPNGMFL